MKICNMRKSVYTSIAVVVLFGVAACGGGSSSGSGSGVTPIPTGAVTITAANADDVSAETTDAIGVTVVGGGLGEDFVTGVVVEEQTSSFNLAGFSKKQLVKLAALEDQLRSFLAVGVVTTVTENCDSGSLSVTWDDVDNNNVFSTRDTFSITFSSCFDAAYQATFNGGVLITNFSLTGDPTIVAPWSMSASFTFSSLAVTEGGQTGKVDGDLSIASETANGVTITSSITSNSFTFSDGVDSGSITGLDATLIENISTLEYSFTIAGTVASTSIGGSVTISTITPFQGNNVDLNFPTSGSIKITGASGTSVTLTATGGDNVQLVVDTDGDGLADITTVTTWTNLDAA